MALHTTTKDGMSIEKTSKHLQAKAENIASWVESCKNHPAASLQQVSLH